jgi:hypothetical protein
MSASTVAQYLAALPAESPRRVIGFAGWEIDVNAGIIAARHEDHSIRQKSGRMFVPLASEVAGERPHFSGRIVKLGGHHRAIFRCSPRGDQYLAAWKQCRCMILAFEFEAIGKLPYSGRSATRACYRCDT